MTLNLSRRGLLLGGASLIASRSAMPATPGPVGGFGRRGGGPPS